MVAVPRGYLTLFSLASFHAGGNLSPVTSGEYLKVDTGVEDLVVANDRPVAVVAGEIMSWLGWEYRG